MCGPATRPLYRVACAVACILAVGCVNSIKNTVPAQCLPEEIRGPSSEGLESIDFTRLGQKAPASHVIGPGDILGIYIQGLLGNGQEVQLDTTFPPDLGDRPTKAWYEHPDSLRDPSIPAVAVGTPIEVMHDGTIALPYAQETFVSGLTVIEAREKIREIYTSKLELLQRGHDSVRVTVIKPRTIQALVLREDSINKWPIFKQNNSTLAVKRGSGVGVDLPVYQNDVLHALTESGGLPGSDSADEVWVLHSASLEHRDRVVPTLNKDMQTYGGMSSRVIRIPLKVWPGQDVDFDPADVILESGDVVFIPARDREHFFVGGVLNGLQVYLPRDYELDVVKAIAMAGGQTVGPPGGALFSKQSPGPIYPPTRVLILRKTPGGEQVTIHVDLKKAIKEPGERIPIRAGDVILLQFTPGQIAGNLALNAFRFRMGFSRSFFSSNAPAGGKFSVFK